MKLYLSKPRGFCAGVERAIETVEKALELWGAPIFVKHEIVHNRYVVDDLRSKGAIFIEDINDVPMGSRLIYSAHGVSPEIRRQAAERNLIEIDATCGLVTRVHSAVKRFANQGYKIVLIGHRNHVEVVGTAGEAPDVTTIVESVEDVKKFATTYGFNIDPNSLIQDITVGQQQKVEIIKALSKKIKLFESYGLSEMASTVLIKNWLLKKTLFCVIDKVN